MFNKNCKLICTVVGLVAVLVMGLAMPGATQQNPLSRGQIIQGLSVLLPGTLTAAEGNILNIEGAVFYSHPEVTLGFAIPDRLSKSWALIEELLVGQEVNPMLGGIYVVEDLTGFLKPGWYIVRAINQNQVALFSVDGDQVAFGKLQIRRLVQVVENPSITQVQLSHASPWCARGSFKGFGVEISIEIGTTCAQ